MRKLSVWLLGGLLVGSLEAAPAKPRLAVVISVDQMRADYLERFRPYFSPGGFLRLADQGANFQNCFYRHSITITAPGHATILSGVNANVHGIISNDWLNETTFLEGNAVEDANSPLVGIVRRGPNPARFGRSPRNFLGTTVGDRLKVKYGAEAKVFGVADKDRSAILMSGAKADGAYWGEDGLFVTSTYYRRELPDWVQAYNQAHPPREFFGRVWDRLLDAKIYDAVQGPDEAIGESGTGGFSRTFPKRVDGGTPDDPRSPAFLTALDLMPWNNDLVAGLARRLIEVENLGADDTPDLLCVGFSQTDRIGHSYGPDSHEIMDSYLRLDRVLAGFIEFIEQRVGLEHCVIVLTADHGVAPIPEQRQQKHGPETAGRMSGTALVAHVRQALDTRFGALPADNFWVVRDSLSFRVNPAALQAKKLTASAVRAVIREAVLSLPGVAHAWTREQLIGSEPLDPFGERMRLSYNVPRSADVVFILKPYWQVGSTPANHGSPYDYDSHVPQLWLGGAIPAGPRAERVATEDLAPTLAALLGVDLPQAKGRVLFGAQSE